MYACAWVCGCVCARIGEAYPLKERVLHQPAVVLVNPRVVPAYPAPHGVWGGWACVDYKGKGVGTEGRGEGVVVVG